jgi:hypothetical protein
MLRIGLAAILLANLAWGQQYMISTFAGGPPPYTLAVDAIIGTPVSVAVDTKWGRKGVREIAETFNVHVAAIY